MRFAFAFLYLILNTPTFGQKKASFDLNQLNGEVHISIVISTGNLCNGIRIYRSTDSLHFDEIGVIQGYCGSLNETITYNYTDSEPVKNQVSYYQLELVGLETTVIKSILVIDLQKGKYKIWPNPIQDTAVVYFDNPLKDEIIFTLYSASGAEVFRSTTVTSFIQIDARLYENGTYLFQIRKKQGEEIAKGKLVIGH